MTVKIDGTNTVANPAFTGADTDTGLQCGTNELKLVTSGTARVTVDSSGNVGINNSTPSFTLDIDNGQARINRGNSAGDILILRGQNSEKAKFDTDGLKFNGDTGQVNALDDYEEGTFTPSIAQWSGTYDLQEGFYTKIGRHVIATGRVRTNGGTGSFSSNAFPQVSIPIPTSNSITRAGSAVEGHWSHASGQTSTLSNSSTVISAGHFDAPTAGTAMFPNNFRGGDVLGNYNTNNMSNSSDMEMRFSMSYHVD